MRRVALVIAALATILMVMACGGPVRSVSGTKMSVAGSVKLNAKGHTVEQQNIHDRITMDNAPGSIKHLYIISSYSGQVLIYSTVKGKVTSSGKRLTPDKVVPTSTTFDLNIGTDTFQTDQILGEDGTFGPSAEYLYWWDARGAYHQQYVTGGMILHISDQPVAVKGIVINMELTGAK